MIQTDRLGALFSVALAVGLRLGEALGLRCTVALPEVTAEALKPHRTRQLEERLEAGSRWHDSGSEMSGMATGGIKIDVRAAKVLRFGPMHGEVGLDVYTWFQVSGR